MALKRKQSYALKLLKEGENVFLSGEGGTGKSFVIQEFITYLDGKGVKYTVCAPTGLASLHIGGATLHRTFKLSTDLGDNEVDLKNVEESEVIIIDEISMCRRDIFQYIANALFAFENSLEELPIEQEAKVVRKKQIVVVGDFFQLPPVLGKQDRKSLEVMRKQDEEMGTDFYKHITDLDKRMYPFQCEEWDTFNFKCIVLDEVVRQNDKDYIDNLNKVRRGDPQGLEFIKENSAKDEIKDAIFLTARNADADNLNQKNLDKIKEKPYTYYAETVGEGSEADKAAPAFLKLKKGARVMSVVNIKDKNETIDIVNGLCGTVTSLDEDSVTVKFDDGQRHTFEKYKWSVKGYEEQTVIEKGKEVKKVVLSEIGVYRQIPLKLSYAITIHKSQGQSYDCVNLDPDCFAEGQLYVALSRAKVLDKLYLTKALRKEFLKTSEVVKEFYKRIELEQQKEGMEKLVEKEVAITEVEEKEELSLLQKIGAEIDAIEDEIPVIHETDKITQEEAPGTDSEEYINMNIPKSFQKEVLSILEDGYANQVNRLNKYAENLERDLTKAEASNAKKNIKIRRLEKQLEELTQELEKLKASSGRRPKISKDIEFKIIELRKLGMSMNRIATRVGVGDGTVKRILNDNNMR